MALSGAPLKGPVAGPEVDVHKVDKNMAVPKVDEDADTVWIDSKDIPMEGNAFWPGPGSQFCRLPPDAKDKVSRAVYGLAHHSAGIQFRFNTDSKFIHLKWVSSGGAHAGYCDTYRYVDDNFGWRYWGCLIDLGKGQEKSYKVEWMPNKPCLINLPNYQAMESFRLGISKGAKIWAAPPHKSGIVKPVVFYGTSITQGAWGSRPGMAFVNIIGRRLDVPVVNLGFSGNGDMQLPMVEYLARSDASCYVIDTGANNNGVTRKGGRGDTFLRELRSLRPDVPIVLCETSVAHRYSRRTWAHGRDRDIRELYEQLVSEGWKRLHYLPADDMFADDEDGTLDRSHPNDWGMMHLAYAYGDKIAEALGIPPMKKLKVRAHSPYEASTAPEAATAAEPPETIECEGWYDGHLQGVAADGTNVWWSFTKTLVRTDLSGKVLASARVPSHHGDPCYKDGKLYVAVNLGKFNQDDKGVSSVCAYDATTLAHVKTWPVDMPHGAGGMTSRGDRFYVVGGLPSWVEVNYVYEYDADFNLVKRHELQTGSTQMGIQTAHWDGRCFCFGVYGGMGNPNGIIRCDPELKTFKRYKCGGAEGIAHIGGKLYIARLLHRKGAADGLKNGARLVRQDESKVYSPANIVDFTKRTGLGRLFLDLGGDTSPYAFGTTKYRFGVNGYYFLCFADDLIAETKEGRLDYNAYDVSKKAGYSIPDILRGIRRISVSGETLVLRSREGICPEGMSEEVYRAVLAEAETLGVKVVEFRK